MNTESYLMEKYQGLVRLLGSMGSAVVAFSGGVDSAFLLHAAREALGDRVLAVTMSTSFFPEREGTEARQFCEDREIPYQILSADILRVEGVAENPVNRCYLCKKALFGRIRQLASQKGFQEVIEGSNKDDDGDYRPGLQAIQELGIRSPLRELCFTKAEIRKLSAAAGLPTWNKPSYACLASRFPYGDEITEGKLRMVDRAEELLLRSGFRQMRVRIHDSLARVEIEPQDFDRILDKKLRQEIAKGFKEIGFQYTALDLTGYRTGSMNENL